MNTAAPSLRRLISPLASCAAALLFAAASQPIAVAVEPTLQLKDNDVWVMAGDSITAQRLHTNFIEAYFRTRYPKLNLHFRNSGIGGNRTGNILARFDYDVAAWKPTIVSIELGMNDVNGPEDVYIKGMKDLIAKIRAIPAQPVLISSSPVDDGSIIGDWRSPRCEKIDAFTNALKKLATEEQVVFVDQYHSLIDIWGKNRRLGAEAAAKKEGAQPAIPAATPAPPALPPGATPAPVKAPPIPPSLIPLGGDPVHTGPVGQTTMAAAILSGWKASGEASAATLTADGKVVESKRCQITGATAKDGKLSFTRVDEAGSWPILPSAKTALEVFPDTLKLSQYLLRVTGLADGVYRVSINGKPAGTISAKDLATGWNLTKVFDGALGERSTKINGLITKLQGDLNVAWRAASKLKDAAAIDTAQKAIEAAEAEVQTAVQPVPLLFEIAK